MQSRRELQTETSPGPGAYEPADHLVKSSTKGFKQSQSQRADIVAKEMKTKPGPGAYTSG